MKKTYSGFPDDCSPEQLEALAKFRTEVRNQGCTDPPYDDPYLLRFLRARKFDLPKTLLMWNNFIKWRKENNVDEILAKEFPEIPEAKKYYPHGYFRTDKLGRPIYIERIGHLKFDPLVKTIPLEKLQLYFVQSYERLIFEIFPACSRATGKRVEQTCYIIDLKGAGMKMFSSKMREIINLASKIGQDYYPEILGSMFIINAPMFFSGIWSVIKVFLDEKTVKKINILGSSYQKELDKYIAPENLPDFLGGKVTSQDYGEPFGNEQGPWKDDQFKGLNLIKPNEEIEVIPAQKQTIQIEPVPVKQEVVEEKHLQASVPEVRANEEHPMLFDDRKIYSICPIPEDHEPEREREVRANGEHPMVLENERIVSIRPINEGHEPEWEMPPIAEELPEKNLVRDFNPLICSMGSLTTRR